MKNRENIIFNFSEMMLMLMFMYIQASSDKHLMFPRDTEIMGRCPAGSGLHHKEKVPL